MGFFSKLQIIPQEITDFTSLPAGRHNVEVLDLMECRAKDDITIKDGKLVNKGKDKADFNLAFDQDVLVILLKAINGDGYIIDRLSEKGWLSSTDCDADGVTLMDKAKERTYGYAPTDDGRYIDIETGLGVEHPDKTEVCATMVHKFGTVCNVDVATLARGAKINIKVVDSDPYFSKKLNKMVVNQEVKKYFFYKEDGTLEHDEDEPAPAPTATQAPVVAPAKKPLFAK
jgi:hypothetical protein